MPKTAPDGSNCRRKNRLLKMNQSGQITILLREWSDGKREALDKLLPLVYTELHRQAKRYLRRERPGHTLQTTALIHEAFLKLVAQKDVEWESRTQFFAISAQLMRRILVDHARTRDALKRGGDNLKLPLETAMLVVVNEKNVDLIALDEALTKLAKIDEQQVRFVELRFFSGLSTAEAAEVLKISRATATRDWAMAKAWLHRELTR
jgi:RNA polymerase sigma factor (TIGR02999 family)